MSWQSGVSESGSGRLTFSKALVSECEGHVVLIVIDPSRMAPEAFVLRHDDAVRLETNLSAQIAVAVESAKP